MKIINIAIVFLLSNYWRVGAGLQHETAWENGQITRFQRRASAIESIDFSTASRKGIIRINTLKPTVESR
jgi:hypothetical protein